MTPTRGQRRPTAETVADKLGIPVRTVREWLADNHNAELLDATTTLLALAGVRPVDGVEEEKPADSEAKRPAMLLNLFLGGGDEKPIRVIEGQARELGKPVRLAGEVVRAIAEPGSGG